MIFRGPYPDVEIPETALTPFVMHRAGELADKPALIYIVAPALSFHFDFEYFARMLSPEVELWRWELHENWRKQIKVVARRRYSE